MNGGTGQCCTKSAMSLPVNTLKGCHRAHLTLEDSPKLGVNPRVLHGHGNIPSGYLLEWMLCYWCSASFPMKFPTTTLPSSGMQGDQKLRGIP